VHKLTLQAMWHILMPQPLDYIGGKSISLKDRILEKSAQENGLVEQISILESQEYSNIIDGFVTSRKDDINFLCTDGPICKLYKLFSFCASIIIPSSTCCLSS